MYGVKVERADGGELNVEGVCEAVVDSDAVVILDDLNPRLISGVMVVDQLSEEGKMLLYIDIMAKDCSRKISM